MDEMRIGEITCECGQYFTFETSRPKIYCIHCNKEYDVTSYPIKVDEPPIVVEEGDVNGTGI